jgi:hypothetical protein
VHLVLLQGCYSTKIIWLKSFIDFEKTSPFLFNSIKSKIFVKKCFDSSDFPFFGPNLQVFGPNLQVFGLFLASLRLLACQRISLGHSASKEIIIRTRIVNKRNDPLRSHCPQAILSKKWKFEKFLLKLIDL